jgi:hypothetical protein
MGAKSGSVSRIASPVLPMPASFPRKGEGGANSSDAADGAVPCRMPCAL